MHTYANRNRRATRTTRASRWNAASNITCSGCGSSAKWGCYCLDHLPERGAEILRAFMDAGARLDKRRAALAAMKEWRRLDDIRRLEKKERRRLIEQSNADKAGRMRGLTNGRIGGSLALHLHCRMFEPTLGAPEPIEMLARRHRVPLAMVKELRDRFLRRTSFAARDGSFALPTARAA
jgi:hypothetical protein